MKYEKAVGLLYKYSYKHINTWFKCLMKPTGLGSR